MDEAVRMQSSVSSSNADRSNMDDADTTPVLSKKNQSTLRKERRKRNLTPRCSVEANSQVLSL